MEINTRPSCDQAQGWQPPWISPGGQDLVQTHHLSGTGIDQDRSQHAELGPPLETAAARPEDEQVAPSSPSRSGRIPDLCNWTAGMRLVTTRDATRLTGLSTDQLREWTSRRELIPADVRPKGHGSPAQYSWQTILLLRLAVTLRDRFKLELQGHRDLFSSLGRGLSRTSFLSLWGRSLALHGGEAWSLLDSADLPDAADDFIVLRLDPHLQVLSASFSLPRPISSPQFQLFPATGVAGDAAVALARKG